METRATPRRQVISLQLPDKPVFVEGDPTRLEQIFTNLVDNASKYTDAGGTIQVAASTFARGGQGWIRVAIVDTGIGMTAESSGFDHHLVKPVDTKRIEELIADLRHTRETSHRTRISGG